MKKNIFKIITSFLIIITILFQTNLTVLAASSTLTGTPSTSSVNLNIFKVLCVRINSKKVKFLIFKNY